MKIKKGDTVEVIAGKDAGKRGRVLRVDRDRVEPVTKPCLLEALPNEHVGPVAAAGQHDDQRVVARVGGRRLNRRDGHLRGRHTKATGQ